MKVRKRKKAGEKDSKIDDKAPNGTAQHNNHHSHWRCVFMIVLPFTFCSSFWAIVVVVSRLLLPAFVVWSITFYGHCHGTICHTHTARTTEGIPKKPLLFSLSLPPRKSLRMWIDWHEFCTFGQWRRFVLVPFVCCLLSLSTRRLQYGFFPNCYFCLGFQKQHRKRQQKRKPTPPRALRRPKKWWEKLKWKHSNKRKMRERESSNKQRHKPKLVHVLLQCQSSKTLSLSLSLSLMFWRVSHTLPILGHKKPAF